MTIFLKELIRDNNILNIYIHGSKVYGTSSPNSDTDYIVVEDLELLPFKTVEDENNSDTIKVENDDYSFISKENWKNQALNNSLDFVEVFYSPIQFKVKETYIPEFTLDKELIRRNFSKVSSNSWVKCKKKLEVEKDFDPYIGKKSLFHSLRILIFGIDLLKNETINYQKANYLYKEIVLNDFIDWNYFKDKFQPLRNQLKTEFKEVYKIK